MQIHDYSIKCKLFSIYVAFLVFIVHFCLLTFKWPRYNYIASNQEGLNGLNCPLRTYHGTFNYYFYIDFCYCYCVRVIISVKIYAVIRVCAMLLEVSNTVVYVQMQIRPGDSWIFCCWKFYWKRYYYYASQRWSSIISSACRLCTNCGLTYHRFISLTSTDLCANSFRNACSHKLTLALEKDSQILA